MKCIKCQGEVLPGNSRVIKRNGRSLRQHRVCPERTAASVDKNQQARSSATKPSEPKPVNQASVSQNQMPNYRFFITETFRNKLMQLKPILAGKLTIEIEYVNAEFAEANPEGLEGYFEIKVGGE